MVKITVWVVMRRCDEYNGTGVVDDGVIIISDDEEERVMMLVSVHV